MHATSAVGDTICVHYNNKKYYIDIVEARPQAAISVIETDCEVGDLGAMRDDEATLALGSLELPCTLCVGMGSGVQEGTWVVKRAGQTWWGGHSQLQLCSPSQPHPAPSSLLQKPAIMY